MLREKKIKNVRIKPEEYVTKIKEAVTKAGKKVRVGDGHIDWLGSFQPLERTISCDQVANKLKSIMEGAKTKTGKFFAKAIHKIHRGFTFGGGEYLIQGITVRSVLPSDMVTA